MSSPTLSAVSSAFSAPRLLSADSPHSLSAGGNVLGNGSWVNVGGNNAVTTGGVSNSALNLTEGGGAYKDYSGGKAARVMTPCVNETCVWHDDPDFMDEAERWYPTLEAVEDGSNIIMGGELVSSLARHWREQSRTKTDPPFRLQWGGFVNSVNQMQNTPT